MKIQVKIPEKAKILVKVGDKVDFKTPLYTKNDKKKISVPIAEKMGLRPENIFMVLKKVIGDKLQKGDIIAENKSFFSTTRYLSELNGVISSIDSKNGIIVIEEDSDQDSVCNCHFTGTIDGVYDGYLELIISDAHKIKTSQSTPEFGGMVHYHISSNTNLTDDEVEGSCIFLRDMDEIETAKLETLGAKAIILNKKIESMSELAKIIIEKEDDFKHLETKRFPYLLVSHEPNTVIFYK